jgi:hypothetical protein
LSADRKREAAENSDLPRDGRLHLLPSNVNDVPWRCSAATLAMASGRACS